MLLEIRDISVHYDRVKALRGVSFSVMGGSIITLIGANGAGKTTTLNAVSGIVKISAGSIWFQGERIDRQSAERIVADGIAQVPEGRRIFPFMTTFENIKIGAYHRKWDQAVSREIERIYAHFPVLKERRKQKAGSLSGGEQQMLAIARALMAKPKLLLLDEPSMGLAPMMVEEISRIIQEINQQGVSITLVEQNARMAFELAHFGYVMEVGKTGLEGETAALGKDPRVQAAYLGG